MLRESFIPSTVLSCHMTNRPGIVLAKGDHVGILVGAERFAEPHNKEAFEQIRLSLGVLTQEEIQLIVKRYRLTSVISEIFELDILKDH